MKKRYTAPELVVEVLSEVGYIMPELTPKITPSDVVKMISTKRRGGMDSPWSNL